MRAASTRTHWKVFLRIVSQLNGPEPDFVPIENQKKFLGTRWANYGRRPHVQGICLCASTMVGGILPGMAIQKSNVLHQQQTGVGANRPQSVYMDAIGYLSIRRRRTSATSSPLHWRTKSRVWWHFCIRRQSYKFLLEFIFTCTLPSIFEHFFPKFLDTCLRFFNDFFEELAHLNWAMCGLIAYKL